MNNWYLFSVIALILLGSQRFLYKVAAENGCRSALTTAVFMGTVTLLSFAAFLGSEQSSRSYPALIILSLVNSSSFALATMAHIEALKFLPAGITFPLTRLSLVVVIFASVVYFDERLSSLQWLGVLLGFAVVAITAKDAGTDMPPKNDIRAGLLFVLVCIVCGAIASVSCKLAADSTSTSEFMTLTYLFGTFFSLAIYKKGLRTLPSGRLRVAVTIGISMGVLNFFGFYAFLTALANGPLALIALITGMHFVIAIFLSVLVYRERMSLRRSLGIGLTLLAVFLLKQ